MPKSGTVVLKMLYLQYPSFAPDRWPDSRTDGQWIGQPDGQVVILTPLVTPTCQLMFSSAQLSWQVGAKCGNELKRS